MGRQSRNPLKCQEAAAGNPFSANEPAAPMRILVIAMILAYGSTFAPSPTKMQLAARRPPPPHPGRGHGLAAAGFLREERKCQGDVGVPSPLRPVVFDSRVHLTHRLSSCDRPLRMHDPHESPSGSQCRIFALLEPTICAAPPQPCPSHPFHP